MGQLADALKKLQEAPDDLSTLPALIAKVAEVEDNDEMYQKRIRDLQDINRSYLAQIPIPGKDPHEGQGDDETPEPTLEDAKKYLVDYLGGKE